jgi:WD40 repeat protein/tRNA A-37 threonylcarbamoyl transferase component Bud32
MTPPSQSDFENLSLELANQVEQACERFETAWKFQKPPRVEDFVVDVPEAGRAVLLHELILLDLYYRSQAGEQVRAEDYKRRFPDLEAEWLDRTVGGDAPGKVPRAGAKGDGSTTLDPFPVKAPETGSDFNPHGEVPHADGGPPAQVLDEPTSTDVWPNVSDYEILGKLGQGGMGIVYKAYHHRLRRVVALKMILEHAADDEQRRARFRTEAEAVARLQHPHIVQIFDIGEHGNIPYVTLEYAEGGSLDKKLHSTPLPPADAARLVEILARAVHAAHQRGIIHRDLKPANVLLTADGTPKIADFGLAKKLDASVAQTQSGHIVGTPSYMAPEQAAGKISAIGPATDVYALGAILYELLTGRPPFKAATAIDTVLQVLQDEPVSPRKLQPRTPRDLEAICLKCLEKKAGRRYASAAALADDLERWAASKPVRARPVGALRRLLKRVRRRPAPAAAVVLSGLVALLASGVGVVLLQVRERAQHEQYFNQIRLADSLLSTSNSLLSTSNSQSKSLVRADEILEECPDRLRRWEWRYLKRRAYDLSWEKRPEGTLFSYRQRVRSLAFSPVGPLATADKEITIWDASTGWQLRCTFSGHTDAVTCVTYNPDGSRLASASQDKTVKVWYATTALELRTLRGHTGWVHSVAFSADGQHLASASEDKTVKVWDVTTGEELRTLTGHTDAVTCLTYSPDGKRLASASNDKSVKLWDAVNGQQLLTLAEHIDRVNCVTFSPDGQRLASASSDLTVKVWDAITGQELFNLAGHTDRVNSVVFSPDGQRLVSASDDKTVKIWDAATGREILTLEELLDANPPFIRGRPGKVEKLVFSPDGNLLAAAGPDGVQVWDARPVPEKRLGPVSSRP